jgi:hypothetical protein
MLGHLAHCILTFSDLAGDGPGIGEIWPTMQDTMALAERISLVGTLLSDITAGHCFVGYDKASIASSCSETHSML